MAKKNVCVHFEKRKHGSYSKQIKHSEHSNIAYQCAGLIEAPLGKLVSVLRNEERGKEWIKRLKTRQVIQTISQKERIEYWHTEMPWPFQDRDFVLRTQLNFNQKEEKAVILIRSVKHSRFPVMRNRARGKVYYAKIELSFCPSVCRSLKSHCLMKTHIEAEFYANFQGQIPSAMIQKVQERVPPKIFEILQKQATREDVSEDPLVPDYLRSEFGR
jgi:hypothetical protein